MSNDLDNLLMWVVGVLAVWSALSLSIRFTFEKTVKPVLDQVLAMAGYTPQLTPLRPLAIVVGVIASAILTVQATSLNLFEGAPRFILAMIPDGNIQMAITAIFLATGAFIFHGAISWYTSEPNAFTEYAGGELTEAELPSGFSRH